MLDMELTIHDAELQRAITGLGRSINDWRDAWPGVAEALRGMVREQFESEGVRGPQGGWAPLSKAYAARKAKEYPGKPLMRATDRLYDSLVGDSADAVFEVTARTLILGTVVPYAAFSQPASREASGEKRSQRALYDLAEVDLLRVAALVELAARATAEKAGFGRGR